MASIIFTGGGTAGHVTPNLPLMAALKQQGWNIAYIGSEDGIEKEIIAPTKTPFHPISSGKLRRYFSIQNFLDPFRILVGIIQSYLIIKRNKPSVVFSKGGFVAFPVVVGAWLNRIPVVAHESDLSIGLANKLCFPFVKTICVTFEATKNHVKNPEKVIVTGTPVREELFHGNKEKGLALCGFQGNKPCLLVMGGGSGAQSINQTMRDALPELLKQFQIIHLCGKGKLLKDLENEKGYKQFEYANEELADLYACTDLVISRSGANSLYEILALKKPHVLIPLSIKISRGDQIQNARFFEKQGISIVIEDEALNVQTLMQGIEKVLKNKESIIKKMQTLNIQSATNQIVEILRKTLSSKPSS